MDNYHDGLTNQQAGRQPETDLFPMEEYTDAGTGQRFVNWLLDNLLMQYGLSYITGTLVGIIISSLFPDFAIRIIEDQTNIDLIIIGYTIAIFNYLLYYSICEKAFKGYTLGKLISGTRAIRQDGQELTFRDAFLRSLSRLVPFEPFSALGGLPWHDKWTNTRVIKTR